MRPLQLLVLAAGTALVQPAAPAGWLDGPLTNWNTAAAAVPAPPAVEESREQMALRCSVTPAAAETTAGRSVMAAGWMPYRHLDRALVEGDVEVIGGMAAADGMCRPNVFNLFVFVNGHHAGTLSPDPMAPGRDGAAGAVRLLPDGEISAEFARFRKTDAPCCPSSRVTVRFRITRDSFPPVVAPVGLRTTRG